MRNMKFFYNQHPVSPFYLGKVLIVCRTGLAVGAQIVTIILVFNKKKMK